MPRARRETQRFRLVNDKLYDSRPTITNVFIVRVNYCSTASRSPAQVQMGRGGAPEIFYSLELYLQVTPAQFSHSLKKNSCSLSFSLNFDLNTVKKICRNYNQARIHHWG